MTEPDPTQRRRRRLEPVARKAEIVRDAYALFRTRDPQQYSLSDVAQHLGISRGLIYKYFGSLEELVAAAYEDQEEVLHNRIVADALAARTVREAVHRIVDAYVDYVVDHAEVYRIYVGTGLNRANAELRAQRARQDAVTAEFLGGGPYAHIVAESLNPIAQHVMLGWLNRRDLTVPELKTALEQMIWRLFTSFQEIGWVPRTLWEDAAGAGEEETAAAEEVAADTP